MAEVIQVQFEPQQNTWDFHILRNNEPSSPLNKILRIYLKLPQGQVVSIPATPLPQNVTLEFKALFRPAPPHNHGVIVFPKTGIVQATAPPPSEPKLRSFLIQAIVTDKNVNPPNPGIFDKAKIRCHIHDTISRFWLTPSGLTVRRNSSGQRFSLLAQFSDDTVGVIPENAEVQWHSNSTDIPVDVKSGRITANAAASVAIISASLPPSLGGGNVSETVFAADSWDTPTAVNLVQGNPAKLEENYNFLFLPDGFTAAEKPQFEEVVRRFVRDQTRRPSIKPYNILSNSINYWMAFIPSRESGMSVLDQMRPVERNGKLRGFNVDIFIEAIEQLSLSCGEEPIWKLAQLVREVGLPIPGDKKQEFDTMLTSWKKWFGDEIEAHVNDCLYKNWQELADLRIANEKDTALGLASGGPPNVSQSVEDVRVITWHPFRATRKQLDEFLSNLTHNGNTIGNTWVTHKDRPFVIVICGGGRRVGTYTPGGQNKSELTAASLSEEEEVLLKPVVVQNPVVPSLAVDLIPFPNPLNLIAATAGTIVHEVSHSFPLGDEYGGGAVADEAAISGSKKDLNVQDAASLKDPAGMISGNKIKWLWHRIFEAGVLAATPFPIGIIDLKQSYQIKLKSNHASLFEVGDIVRLRKRPLEPSVLVSEEMVVRSKAQDGLDVSLSRPGPPDPERDPESFKVDSLSPDSLAPILFVPFGKQKGSVSTDDFLLVAPKIIQHINNTHGPLNFDERRETTPTRPCNPKDKRLQQEKQYATNLPPELRQKVLPFTSRIVGLYESGSGYDCGIYHPSGTCFMRSKEEKAVDILSKEPGKPISEYILYNFCHVCRYVLVDWIDPSKHGEIDAEYDKQYPL